MVWFSYLATMYCGSQPVPEPTDLLSSNPFKNLYVTNGSIDLSVLPSGQAHASQSSWPMSDIFPTTKSYTIFF